MTQMLNDIPEEFLLSIDKSEDVIIVIGENGCGKSTLLGYLAKYHSEGRMQVVGIANSIHDKFDFRKSNFYALKGRRGRRQTKETIKNALKTISLKENDQGLRNIARALTYVKFDPTIGFSVKNLKPDFESKIYESNDLNDESKDSLVSVLTKLINQRRRDVITWFSMNNSYYENVSSYSFTILFQYESLLKKLKIIEGIDIYLSRKNEPVPIFLASSGELSLITSIIFLSSIIKSRNTVILIDEPENSLHPKWQKEYVNTLVNIFHYYQPKIIIATHSPMIVNGAEMNIKPSIYKADNFNFQLQQKEPKNIEEIFYSFFEITTPENRFLSNLLVSYLNDLASNKIDILSFKRSVEKIKSSIYDERQMTVVEKVEEIANDIVKGK